MSRPKLPPLDKTTGLLLRYGNGCARGGKNCFECKLPDCTYFSHNDFKRAKYGIKVRSVT